MVLLSRAKQAHRGGRGKALPTLDPGARKKWVISAMLRPFCSWKDGQYSWYRKLDGPPGPSG